MAKLSKGNLAAKRDAQISKVDDWNPPIVPSSVAAQMLPPKSRPLPKVPTTPSGNSQTKSSNSLQDLSSRKKRRRRGGKRNGDSASEVTTTISEDTGQAATSPTQNRPEVLVPASQSSLSLLPPNASAEEIRVFENEPEIFGVYASSDEEDQQGKRQPAKVLPRRARIPAYSPSVATGLAESSPVRALQEETVESLQAEPSRPRIESDAASSAVAQIPNPKKMSNGKFECPFKAEYSCTKSFADAKTAKRHANLHVNADRFKCEECGKGFSRQDLLVRHVKSHDKQDGKVERVETARTKQPNGAHLNGAVDTKRVRKGNTAANASKDDLNEPASTDDEAIVHNENSDATELPYATGDADSVESKTDDEAQLNNNRISQNHNSQRNDDGPDGIGGQRSVEESNAENKSAAPSERTISPSPERALSPVETNQFLTVNGGTKRKRPSSRVSPEFEILPSQKRLRRDRDLHSPRNSQQINAMKNKNKNNAITSPAQKSETTLSKVPQDVDADVDVETNVQASRERKEQADVEEVMETDLDNTSGTDVEMKDDEPVQESDHESASSSDDQAPRTFTPISEKVRKGNTESVAVTRTDDDSSGSASQKGEEEVDEDEEDNIKGQGQAEAKPNVAANSGSCQGRSRTADRPRSATRRQSSMDNFVQRSESAATSANASASRSRISIDIPMRSRTQSKKAQGKLVLRERVEPSKSTQSTDNPPAEDSEGDEPRQHNKSKARAGKESQPRDKGKGKARLEASNENGEKTSSEDRPRATTVARRTSSLGSKSRSQLRSRPIPNKRTKPASESEESEPEERPKPKPRRPSKKKAKTSAEEGSEQEKKPKRKAPASTAKSTWAEASKSGVTGKFTEEEIQTLNAWRDSFCEGNNLTAYEFNEMMMNSASVLLTDWRYGWITKADFMQQYYEQLPDRNRRSMIRFRERQFHNADTTPWTEDHDKELRQLVTELGPKWVEIAQIMGRTQDAVNQRWRHKLNYGEKPALMGEWTTEEVKKLEDEVMTFARLKHTTPDDEDLQIPWIAISKKMGTGRTAQQCSNRWRINTSRRVNGKFVKVPHNDRLPGTTVKKPRTPSKMEKRLSGQQSTPKSDKKVYKSKEKIEDSDGEEEDEDTDNESNDVQGDEEPEVDDEQEDLDEDDEGDPQTAPDDEHEQKQDSQHPEEDSASNSEEDEVVPESGPLPSSSRDAVAGPATFTAQLPETSPAATRSPPTKRRKLSQAGSSSQPVPKLTQDISNSQSSPQLHSLSSSQPPTFKTPAVSKNPLKRAIRNRSSPDNALTLSQLHAGTQANSSAKRTTGRTNRTRVPDSAIPEDRPSPGLSLRRRPVRSSSPLMSPLLDVSRGSGVDDGDEDDEDESGSDDRSASGNLVLDFKSPTSFVSARDAAETSDDEDEDGDEQTNTGNGSDADAASSSDSNSDSDSSSDSDSNSDQPTTTNPESDSKPQDSSSSFWKSVNQSFRNLTGLSQSQEGSRAGSQSQGQGQGHDRKVKGRFRLADVLSGEVEEDEESDDD